jgi:sigma-B regulation protein RsbU (phosphoserine phosphatase)
MQALLIKPSTGGFPDGVADQLTNAGWTVTSAPDYRSALSQARSGGIDALVLLAPTDHQPDTAEADLKDLIRLADAGRVATVLITDRHTGDLLDHTSLVDVVSHQAATRDLCARLSTLQRYQTLVRQMERELNSMERLGKRLNRHFSEVEQEMRLAGRLQRAFLPQVDEPIGPLRFATVFRPVSWVSGDIYDVFRVDERHVAFYIADAVGHGMAASLLTMFIKKAVVAKRIFEDRYEILAPGNTIQGLNDALASQALPNAQFVTACYCLVNTDTLEMQYARGGHPYPLLATAGGGITELKTTGGLLGLFPGEQYPTGTVKLKPGDKLILYTDGIEIAYDEQEGQGQKLNHHRRVFEELASCPAAEMVERITDLLDDQAGSLDPRDDVTVLTVEVEHDPATHNG